MLMNFADSSFSIGESCRDKSLRYLKQIKVRNCECVFDAENVATCQIVKKDDKFLSFEFLEFGREKEHLKEESEKDKSDLESQVKELFQKESYMTGYSIAKRLCSDVSKFKSMQVRIDRILNKLKFAK